MRSILFIIIGTIYFQSALGNNLIVNYFQDTTKVKKIKIYKKEQIKPGNVSPKAKATLPKKSTTNIHTKKDSTHIRKNIGIDHPARNQAKMDSIIKAKNKEKFQGK